MSKTLYMVIESFREGDAISVYRRFRDRGRWPRTACGAFPAGLQKIFCRCYQLMEPEDPELLHQWMGNWSDIVDFEVRSVMTSEEARERIAPLLGR